MQNNPYMQYFDAARSVPDIAKKKIQAGKLKGMTNISPMWRIEKLTELFGPAGIGWMTDKETYWVTEGAGEAMVNCTLQLRIFVDGQWSEPICGIGGSKLYGKGVGDGINDEAYKMAQTDALSVACKNLGLAADVYYGMDDTKYAEQGQRTWVTPAAPATPLFRTPSSPAKWTVPATQPTAAQSTEQSIFGELQTALEEVKAAQSQDELIRVWNAHKPNLGWHSDFKAAVKNSPFNPRNNDAKAK